MTIPSFENGWKNGQITLPPIYILEIRKPDKPDSAPVAWLWVERQETRRYDERDRSVHQATIELNVELAKSRVGRGPSKGTSFVASYHATGFNGPSISLTSHSNDHAAVFLDPSSLRGHRVGTYLMNEVVLWAQQWPTATVNSIELLALQAYDENKARRNRFYEQFGLVFNYNDDDCREGLSQPMPVSALTPVDTWRSNIRVLQANEFMGELLDERSNLSAELTLRNLAFKELINERQAAIRKPIAWVFRQLYEQHAQTLAMTGVLIGLVALVWWKWPA